MRRGARSKENGHENDDNAEQTPRKRQRITNNYRNDDSTAGTTNHVPRGLKIEYKDVAPVGGIIKTVRVKNFMCHPHLQVDLHKNVTFIHGRNGSGKSAILAALVLGLGGRPSWLGRGNTLKEYVRTGNDVSEIAIVFNNVGPEAYRPDQYGKEITVERTVTVTGGGKYRIKNAGGVVVSTRFDELGSILRCYNFQLDNPAMILTQDTSRTFLSQCDEKKLYTMFYRGTQLQKMDDDFGMVVRNHEILNETVNRREQIANELQGEIQELQEGIDAHAKAQENRERLCNLAQELGWARYRDAKKELTELENELKEKEQRNIDLTAELSAAQEKRTEADGDVEMKKNNVQQMRSDLENLRREAATIQREADEGRRACQSKKREREKLEHEIAKLMKEKCDNEKLIRDIQNKWMNDDNKKKRDRKEAEKQEAQASVQANMAAIKTKQQEASQVDNGLQEYLASRRSLSMELNAVVSRLRTVQSRINELQMSTSNSLARYGPQAPRLAQLIEEAVARGQFHRRPRGPVGAYVKLKNEHYAVAVEACLGGAMLRAYICHDFEDNRKLEELMRRCGYEGKNRPQIFIRSFGDERRSYDVSGKETTSNKYPNVLSVLEFEDAVVKNMLIDQRRIETVVLFNDEEEMREVMRHQPPARVSSAYDVRGGNVLLYPTFRQYPAPADNTAHFLVKSVEHELQRLQGDMQQIEGEKSRIDNDLARLRQQISSAEQQKQRCQKAMDDCQRQVDQDNRLIRRLDDQISDLVPATMDTQTLEDEIREVERKQEEANQALEVAEAAHREQNAIQVELEDQLSEKRAEVMEREAQMQKQERVVDRLTGEANRRMGDLQNKQRILDQAIKEAEKVVANIDIKKDEVSKLMKEAEQLHQDEMVSKRKCDDIEREMMKLDRHLKSFDKNAENLQVLIDRNKQKMARYERINESLQETRNTLKVLTRAIDIRHHGYHLIKLLTGIVIKQRFIQILSGRGYSGKLIMDQEARTLKIFVEPRESDSSMQHLTVGSQKAQSSSNSRRMQDLRGLSGGERSYSTVGFIAALWEMMNAPCCCMDEFDVFMDQCSRRLIMELLIGFAWQKRPNGQFVFLTPLSVSELPFHERSGLKVFNLQPPRDTKGK